METDMPKIVVTKEFIFSNQEMVALLTQSDSSISDFNVANITEVTRTDAGHNQGNIHVKIELSGY